MTPSPQRSRMLHPATILAVLLVTVVAWSGARPADAQVSEVTIAATFSATGPSAIAGATVLDAVRLAVDEANVSGVGPRITLQTYDDASNNDGAQDAARKQIASDAWVVVGPGTTTSGLIAGPLYAAGGLVAILPYAHGAGGPASPTTFRPVFSTTEMGEALATYLGQVLGGKRAVVIARDNGYGRPITAGFTAVAERLGLSVTRQTFTTPESAAGLAQAAAAAAEQPAIVLGLVDSDAAPVVRALARQGRKPLILGTSAIATDAFAGMFAAEPEFARDAGFFTSGIYAVSPLMLDSANADALAFAARYWARFGREPRWEAAQGYDAARLAIAAVRAAAAAPAGDTRTRREAIRTWLVGLDSSAHAVSSLTGPLWFTPDRGRRQAIRVGHFHGALFESAPVQLVPVSTPTPRELASGALVDLGGGLFARRQQVAFTGVFLNEIPRIDIGQSTFTADFYFWVRYMRGMHQGLANPAEIDFPDLVRGTFDAARPLVERDLDDGTTYRLWRMRGDFKNDFDLHRYPLDRQTLAVRFFNARGASDTLIYALDRRSLPSDIDVAGAGYTAPTAFRNLTQWDPLHVGLRRDILVTQSALGDPSLVGVERVRELSGFRLDATVERRTLATLTKTLLPLGIMALIMYAALYFPHALVKEKITVAITAALSGAVLLTAVNSQLGAVGYTMAVEYVFYLYFMLSLLSILSVLAAEQFRVAGRATAARMTERATRALFLFSVVAMIVVAWVVASRW